MDIRDKIERLSKELLRHQYLYYVKVQPEISDKEYDRMFDELLALENKYPQFVSLNSPTRRIGSDLDNTFPEKRHTIPVLSLDKEYSPEGLEKWINKTLSNAKRDLNFVVEEKIDGASIVLYYNNGLLDSALTRGNGIIGNDVTENIRTINQVPLIIDEPLDCAVRGEIYINKSDFISYNKRFENRYSNPRNLAAGSLRNNKSSIVSKIPLNIFAYEGYFQNRLESTGFPVNDHIEILLKLKKLGFRINQKVGLFSNQKENFGFFQDEFQDLTVGSIKEISDYIKEMIKSREKIDYETDGLVIKVNEISSREILGYTSHHPRWAIAFKFDSPVAMTWLREIQIQIGRNGRVTPVAILNPVRISGSTVSKATLHNQEYIDLLELGIGDRVSISKRGDIIPAVEEVIDKNTDHPSIYKLSTKCPFCSFELVKDGSHHFCKNRNCPERQKRSIIHFAAKEQMDIDGLGERTIDFLFKKGFVRRIPDLYSFDYDLLLNEEGFKEKKVKNIKKSLEKSKTMPFRKVLLSLGFEGLGVNTVSELVKNGFDSIDKIIKAAGEKKPEIFSSLDGFGEIMADSLIQQFTDSRNLKLVEELKKTGLNFEEIIQDNKKFESIFKDQLWVITGSFVHFVPRSKAAEEIEKRGGKLNSSITSKVTHLLCGSSPGSKFDKAKKQNIRIVEEDEFQKMIR